MNPFLACFGAIQGNAASDGYFVTISASGDFTLGCNRFFVSGWNQWELIEAGAGAPVLYGASLPTSLTGPALVRKFMDDAVANGFNVMRAWAHTVSSAYALQYAPGQYNENVFQGLDYALDQARQHGLKVVLSFVNNWPGAGGIDEYVSWSGTAKAHEDFFSDANCRQLYKNHVNTIINRVNAINGRRYRDDPTIMAWNLVNEPRCYRCPDALQAFIQEMSAYVKSLGTNHLLTIGEEGFYAASDTAPALTANPQQAFIEEMSAYVKSLDTNHLLTIGEEGFYAASDTARALTANPQQAQTWALNEGQDFIRNHNVPNIDYASFHSWADNWQDTTETFQRGWIQVHAADAAALNKPVILEEFGKQSVPGTDNEGLRDTLYRIVYEEVHANAQAGGAIKGSAFWQWYEDGQVGPSDEGGGSGLYGIRSSSVAFPRIKADAALMKGLSTPVASCPEAKPSPLGAVTGCSSTWVGGRQGTGYEGPSCTLDINECVRQTDGCGANSGCVNTPGSYQCVCHYGYTGDGQTGCTATPAAQQINASFATAGPGQLACSQGSDVQYPPGAPGFGYDPTGSTKSNSALAGGVGSLYPVSAQDCQVACLMAPACDSLTYNPASQQCFLKSGGSSASICPVLYQMCFKFA
ncbi:hypothetical protein WJX72_001044 [[Myrmecia] bisecta]|uniref:mannan endo-1,4-beta-mannosidase n=1 Tax=[Myrmecia] bisecta TaxID=41462 RepID=A0AAW1PBW8_9CHLO